MKNINKIKTKNSGFTIVELMISTAVFSFVLLVTSAGVIAIGKSYYKSLTSNRVHEAARSVTADISSSIQFSDPGTINVQMTDPDNTGVIVRCFGADRYRYFIGQQVDATHHGLYRDKRPVASTCNGCDSAGLAVNGINCVHPGVFSSGQELLGSGMRLLQFDVSNNNPFAITVKVGYGDNDLLQVTQCHGSMVGGVCQNPTNEDIATASCQDIKGSNFCAVSKLETAVTGRVE